MVPVAACRRGIPGAQGINWEKKEEDIVENMEKGLTDAKKLELGEPPMSGERVWTNWIGFQVRRGPPCLQPPLPPLVKIGFIYELFKSHPQP